MLGVRNYSREYVDACRKRVEADLAAFRTLVAAVPGGGDSRAAIEAFEVRFFNGLVLVLDEMFVHRLRTVEGKDGNPMNEVRVLVSSLLLNNGVLAADASIKLSPERSVLKLNVGDEICLNEAAFVALAEAYFAAVEAKFV